MSRLRNTVILTASVLSLTILTREPSAGATPNAAPLGSVTHYSVTELASLGGSLVFPSSINQQGVIVGGSTNAGDVDILPALWSGNGITALPTLGGPNAFDNVINDAGASGGSGDTTTPNPLGEDYCGTVTFLVCAAILWSGQNATVLPTLGGYDAQVLFGFNNRGHAVGESETAAVDQTCSAPQVLNTGAAMWGPSPALVTQLPYLPGDPDAIATSINQRDVVVGSTGPCSSISEHIVMWRSGRVTSLGTLNGLPFNNAANSINNRDQVVGYSPAPGTGPHAYLWQNGVMTDLGLLPGHRLSAAFGINDSGQIVGAAYGSGPTDATIWDRNGLSNLNDLVAGPTTAYLTQAVWINNQGDIIGYGFDVNTGNAIGFLAVPTRMTLSGPRVHLHPASIPIRAREQLLRVQRMQHRLLPS